MSRGREGREQQLDPDSGDQPSTSCSVRLSLWLHESVEILLLFCLFRPLPLESFMKL